MAPFIESKWGQGRWWYSRYETVKDALVNYTDQFGEWFQMPIFERLFEGKGNKL